MPAAFKVPTIEILGKQQKPQRVGQVPSEISSLYDAVCSLENNLSSLEESLKTVLVAVPGVPKEEPVCIQDLVLIASRIRDSRLRVQSMDDRILSILERIEL